MIKININNIENMIVFESVNDDHEGCIFSNKVTGSQVQVR